MNPELRSSAAHVFVGSLDAPRLGADDEHHLRRVLRVGERDVITASDGTGRWSLAHLTADGLALFGEVRDEPPMAPVRVRTAIPKGARAEWMVQKLTEVGATEITFVDCARSVIRWPPDRATRQLDRLGRIALQSSRQARRVWLPIIAGPVPFAEALGDGVLLADPSGGPLACRPTAVLVGPEGGWTAEELAAVPARVCLGPLVLRVETAALVAAVALGRAS